MKIHRAMGIDGVDIWGTDSKYCSNHNVWQSLFVNAADLEFCFPFSFCELENGHRRLNKATQKQLLFSDVLQWSILSQGQNCLSLSTSLLLSSYLQKLQLEPTAWRRRGDEINFSKTVTCHLLFCLGCSEINKSHPQQGFSSFETLCWG